jgi:aryl-alcohol dehydrogenase-like predicted oxidoreductase
MADVGQPGSLARRALGSTGLECSLLGFGSGDNAGLMVVGSPSERERAVGEAIDSGVNYFDTAPSYGKGRGEEHMGKALGKRRDEVIVVTKVEIMPADRHRIAARVKDSLAASLKRLKTDHVDVVMIHNPPRREHDWQNLVWTPLTAEDYLREDGALAGLDAVISAGMAHHGGIACENVDPIALRDLLAEPLVEVLNVWLNVMNPSALVRRSATEVRGVSDFRGIADDAAAHHVGISAFRTLAGGAAMSAVSGVLERHRYAGGAYAHNKRWYEREVQMTSEITKALSLTDVAGVVELFYRFAITDARICTAVGGFSEVEHLRAAIRATQQGPLPEDDFNRVLTTWSDLFMAPAGAA